MINSIAVCHCTAPAGDDDDDGDDDDVAKILLLSFGHNSLSLFLFPRLPPFPLSPRESGPQLEIPMLLDNSSLLWYISAQHRNGPLAHLS